MTSHLAICLSLAVGVAAGEPDGRSPVEPTRLPAPEERVEPVKPSLTKLPDGRMQLGKVVFDPRKREIRVPVEVNQTEGLLEFLLVHQNGKVHESLFRTDISATNLNVAFKLLKYQASRELYMKLDPDGSLSSEFEEATPEQKKNSRISISVEWSKDGETKVEEVRRLISHANTETPMPNSPWIYGGSFVYEGKFVAESSGDLVAIFLSNAALINFSGKDNEFDDVWLPHPTRIPPEGTKATLIIAPYEP